MEVAKVKRVGPIYLELDGDYVELVVGDFTKYRLVTARLSEWSSEAFLVAFSETLLELYESEFKREEAKIRRLREKIGELKSKGFDSRSEEKDLERHEREAKKYAKRLDVLKSFVEEFKAVLGEERW